MEKKKCKGCGQELPLLMFYGNARMKDGYSSLCKRCHRERYCKPATRNGILPGYSTAELIAEIERRGIHVKVEGDV